MLNYFNSYKFAIPDDDQKGNYNKKNIDLKEL